jgi:hypothetical protein
MKKYTIRFSYEVNTDNADDSGLRASKYYCEAEDEDEALEQFEEDITDYHSIIEVYSREIPKETNED